MMLFSLIRDIKYVISSINEYIKTKENRTQAALKLLEFVQLHGLAIQLSLIEDHHHYSQFNYNFKIKLFRLVNAFSKIYQPFFVIMFSWTSAAVCDTMLLIKIELVEHSFYFLF